MTAPLPEINDGQAVNAIRWNSLIGRVNAVAPAIEPTPWTPVALGFGWQPFGPPYLPLQYSVLGDIARLRGVIRLTTNQPANTRAATLPVDARPVAQHAFGVITGTNTSTRVDVLTTGEIRVLPAVPTGTTLLFDGISLWLS